MKKLGVQLYSVRNTMNNAENIRATFRRLKAMGYDEGQTAGCAIPYAEFGQIAKEEGIAIVGTHDNFEMMCTDIERVMENHRALGTTNIGIGGMHYADEKAIYDFCAKANRIAEQIAPYGFKFTYHNHSHEFMRYGDKTAMDILVAELDPEKTSFVLDTYWVQHGGGDVRAWIEKLAGRIDILHLKDMGRNEQGPFITECGHGNINFDGIIPLAEQCGVRYFCVEQDTCPGDPFDSVAYSAQYLKKFIR